MFGTSFSPVFNPVPGLVTALYPSINVLGIQGLQRVFGELAFR